MASSPHLRRGTLAPLFLRQAEAEYKDALLLSKNGHPSTVLTLLQSSSEKATKAFLATLYPTRPFFDRLKDLSHQPIGKAPRAQKLIKAEIGLSALSLLLELEDMQPSLASPSSPNPQYPWMVGLTNAVEIPVRFYSTAHVERYLPSVRRLLSTVKKHVR